MKMPSAKPIRATRAFRSPPPRRRTIRRGQPRNTSAPIITSAPSRKRVAGEEPPFALNSPFTRAMTMAPSTRPMISGRMYWTFAAPCRPRPPAMSRSKQAMQKPMFAGLPKALSAKAAMPTATPASTTNQFTFFIVPSNNRSIRFSIPYYKSRSDKNRMEKRNDTVPQIGYSDKRISLVRSFTN